MIAPDLPPLTPAELRRYGRHLTLAEVGVDGQRRLKAGRVLLIGAGGLGSPAALYLAAAGVGTIGLVDYDVVDESNLQRQVAHGTAAVGHSKLESMRARLADLNPLVRVETFETRLDRSNALEILAGFDVILDGTDNFATRYLVNDACVLLGKPNAYGSILRFEGQASVFDARRGPCYRCLFPEPPPPGVVPSCAEAGVLGVLPGIIGAIQANEAIKLLLGAGEPLIGRLVLFDALALRFRELQLRKDPECPLCGEHPTQTELADYDALCAGPAHPAGAGPETDVAPHELRDRLARGEDLLLVDVREPFEREIATLAGGVHIPLGALPARHAELPRARTLVLYCHRGVRSLRGLEFLRGEGFPHVYHLAGGIDAWSREVDAAVPRY